MCSGYRIAKDTRYIDRSVLYSSAFLQRLHMYSLENYRKGWIIRNVYGTISK